MAHISKYNIAYIHPCTTLPTLMQLNYKYYCNLVCLNLHLLVLYKYIVGNSCCMSWYMLMFVSAQHSDYRCALLYTL